VTDLHLLRARVQCKHCSALVWPEEGAICCKGGKAILGPEYNPPIDEDYLELLNLPHFSHDSRLLNAALAMGTQGVYPSRAMGGLGFHEQYYAHLALYGKTYLALYQVGANNVWDNYLLSRELLVDGAANDLGVGYAQRLGRVREAHHPLSRLLYTQEQLLGEHIYMPLLCTKVTIDL
jgi:hypothetical protein